MGTLSSTKTGRTIETMMGTAETRAAFNWTLLRYFTLYRLAIALPAAIFALSGRHFPPFGETGPQVFLIASLVYAGMALIGLVTVRRRWPNYSTQASGFAFADIVLITLLLNASGGLASGLGLLLFITVASGGLVLSARLSLFFAAFATLALLLEHSWGVFRGQPFVFTTLPQVGILGLLLFATAGLTHMLAKRLRVSEALAHQRGIDLANMALTNELVIERLQAGVVVCDQSGRVHKLNKTARVFLGVGAIEDGSATELIDLSPDLAGHLLAWTGKAPGRERKPLVTRAGYTLLPRFMPIGHRKQDTGVVIFLDDFAVLKQQAQQLKLAALARLTASIAHEIRNPLGAIIHAGQLLAEAANQDDEDKRLVRIIEDQSRRMNAIVENILQIGSRDHVKPVKLAIDAWLRQFIHQFGESHRLPTEAFAVVAAPEARACVDPEQLGQVAANLCQNALRHSPPYAGQPLIALKAGYDEDKRPFLDVIDWGAGVPKDIADSIFDPFFTTTPKGTGLGLYIARELCEANGAHLDHHPGEGKGSRFRISFARAEDCLDSNVEGASEHSGIQQ
jgi:two-component system sensor histidine kinase PilS (NtrC family)